MDIRSNRPWPASALSNFAPHAFNFRGLPVNSMEGLLQGLKFDDPEEQRQVFLLVGRDAKRRGGGRPWRRTQTLWWQGRPVGRHSREYQDLLDEAYDALFGQNGEARAALLATGDQGLTHHLGKTDPRQTVLTAQEFCRRLVRLRGEFPRTLNRA